MCGKETGQFGLGWRLPRWGCSHRAHRNGQDVGICPRAAAARAERARFVCSSSTLLKSRKPRPGVLHNFLCRSLVRYALIFF